MSFEPLFLLRFRIARLGEQDWMQWWASHALTPTGAYLIPRLFRRTARLSAAHVALATARVRHAALVPSEPLVHLFDFGDAFEGEFERWLIERKAAAWEPPQLPAPTEDARATAAAALALMQVDAGVDDRAQGDAAAASRASNGGALALGRVSRAALESPARRLKLAHQLAAAYVASGPGTLVPPYLRVSEA